MNVAVFIAIIAIIISIIALVIVIIQISDEPRSVDVDTLSGLDCLNNQVARFKLNSTEAISKWVCTDDTPSLHITIRSNSISIPPGEYGHVEALCNPDEIVTGGGYNTVGSDGLKGHVTLASLPASTFGWQAAATNIGITNLTLGVDAMCLSISYP